MKRVRSAGLGSVDGSGDATAGELREDVERTREGVDEAAEGVAGTMRRARDRVPVPPAVTNAVTNAVANAPAKAVSSAKLLVSMVGAVRLVVGAGSAVIAAGVVWRVARGVQARRAARNRGLRGLARRLGRRG